MKKKLYTVKTLSILVSITLTIIAGLLAEEFIIWFSNFLIEIAKPMSSWTLSTPIFAVSIGSIPYLSYLAWTKVADKKLITFFTYCLINWLSMLVICIAVFFYLDYFSEPKNSLLPGTLVFLPFAEFWNLILPISSVVMPAALYAGKNKTRKALNKNILKRSTHPQSTDNHKNTNR